jgi:hypothetical protein
MAEAQAHRRDRLTVVFETLTALIGDPEAEKGVAERLKPVP